MAQYFSSISIVLIFLIKMVIIFLCQDLRMKTIVLKRYVLLVKNHLRHFRAKTSCIVLLRVIITVDKSIADLPIKRLKSVLFVEKM